MDQNFSEIQYYVTKKTKLRKFYDSNKILIYSSILFLIISLGSVTYYFDHKEKKQVLLSEKYIQAKISL